MRNFRNGRLTINLPLFRQWINGVIVLCLVCLLGLLTACGSGTAAQTLAATPTHNSVPTATPTPPPTPKPTAVLTPKPTTVAVVPTQPPTSTPAAILDLRPSSMSFVGHLDCQKNGAFVCLARVLSRQGNQSNLNWVAYTNIPGNIVFSPVRGTLAPGQSILVTITIPLKACTQGLFFFQGPVNTHTITWAC